MMHNWFTCKIRYEKTMENGMQKKVTEPYLVDALSFTEAESRIIEEMTPFISGEFEVAGVAKANFNELFPSEEEFADRWFKCKLWFITLDEKSGAEKRTASNVLVQASDLRDAIKKLDEGMKDTMADYVISSVSETAIMDVYPYEAEPDVKPEFETPIRDEYREDLYPSPRMPLPPVRRDRLSNRICRERCATGISPAESMSAMPGQRTYLAQRNSNQTD